MANLYYTISHFSKTVEGCKVYFMRIDNVFGFYFELFGKKYGNFVRSKNKSQAKLDELQGYLEQSARVMIEKIHAKTI